MTLLDIIHKLLATAQSQPELQQQQCDVSITTFDQEGQVTWTLDSETR